MIFGSSNRHLRTLRIFAVIFSIFIAAMTDGRAMVISLTFDSSITGLANAAQVEAAINLGAQALDTLYTNVMTANITVYFNPDVDLGESTTFETGNPTYAQITNYLRAARTTLADSNSVASLPRTDPTGGTGVWWLPRAEAKALGGVFSVPTNSSSMDGYVYFASTVNYALSPTNRAIAGEYDLTGIAEHEISEVLGRGVGLNIPVGTNFSGFVPYDLFRFTNSAARSLSTSAASPYFSVDNGVTPLAYFNPDINAGDLQDWQVHNPADSFDYELTDGQEGYLSSADLTSLDILGYSLNFRPPKLSAARTAGGTMQLTFTNVTGLDFSILATTNIATSITNWTNLGTPMETAIGQYQFTDSFTNTARFYRVKLN